MKTVKIRIPVAVDPAGRWYAHAQSTDGGQFPTNHDELLETVDLTECGPHEALFWVTAELPVPEVTEAAADVEAA